MRYHALGSTGIQVSALAFGAGPVSQLLTGDNVDSQRRTLAAAIAVGINWIDTAATYGEGRSEENLGRALADLGAAEQVHVATKVRVMPDQLGRITADGARQRREQPAPAAATARYAAASSQLDHRVAGAEPTSLTPAHVLAPGGLLEEMQRLRAAGLVEHFGLTALGEPAALREVIDTGHFATIQIPYNLLNPSAGRDVPADFAEANYGNLIGHAAGLGMGAFAIRVLAGGALAGKPPSPHTLKTPFFPLGPLPARLPSGRAAGRVVASGHAARGSRRALRAEPSGSHQRDRRLCHARRSRRRGTLCGSRATRRSADSPLK